MAVKIYLDQGHNPRNPNAGAEGNGYREQDLVYEIGIRAAEIMRAGGLEVRVSRPEPDTQLGSTNAESLRLRADGANAFGADYFISLHANASDIASASGSEALVYAIPGRSVPLAENILTQLNEITGLPNRGITPRPGLYVLRKTRMPAVLVELGFITNAYDASLMAEQPDLFALGVANGVFAFLGML